MSAAPLPTPRLRQVCLAVPQLAPVVEALQAILGLAVCHRDPLLAGFGLHNALLPVGGDFLELVSPLPGQADTAAGRFIARSQGHGGYMAIFQTPQPLAHQAVATALGVRTAHEIDVPGYRSVQLHPRDCRAAFIEYGHTCALPGEAPPPPEAWWPAGPHAAGHSAPPAAGSAPLRLTGLRLESPMPADLARHWAALLGVPVDDRHPQGPVLVLGAHRLQVVPGPAEVLGTVQLALADPAAALRQAVAHGLWVQGDRFHLGGVFFQLQPQA